MGPSAKFALAIMDSVFKKQWAQNIKCPEDYRKGGGSDLLVVKDHQKGQFLSDLFPNGSISLSLL